jgi:hypothetical protein
VSDPTQSPQPGKEPGADDAPAAVGSEEPTLAHPAAPPTPTPAAAPADVIMAAAQERPELAVGAAFAGGLVLAMILKRLAR